MNKKSQSLSLNRIQLNLLRLYNKIANEVGAPIVSETLESYNRLGRSLGIIKSFTTNSRTLEKLMKEIGFDLSADLYERAISTLSEKERADLIISILTKEELLKVVWNYIEEYINKY